MIESQKENKQPTIYINFCNIISLFNHSRIQTQQTCRHFGFDVELWKHLSISLKESMKLPKFDAANFLKY